MAKTCFKNNSWKNKVVLRKIYSKFHHSKQGSQDPLFPMKVLAFKGSSQSNSGEFTSSGWLYV